MTEVNNWVKDRRPIVCHLMLMAEWLTKVSKVLLYALYVFLCYYILSSFIMFLVCITNVPELCKHP